ncbi:MAG: mycothione reductase [Actinobacteria bacterium HGW-Actinobacteria-2]|nr:MAG: mycothione reductase [Actinobacteria bacterium HGW-Actinobacteria-2]
MADFDLCVIGSGAGNAIITKRFADWRVALVDGQKWFGGTCLNVGCIPTKMFVYPADLAQLARHAGDLGVDVGGVNVDWPRLRDRIFGRIDPVAESEQAYRLAQPNVTLIRERARFIGPKKLKVASREFTADRFVIAAGSRPFVPEVTGLDDPTVAERVHTSDSIMRLAELPKSLIIVGGGAIAAEFAHIFAAFGTQVTVLHRGQRLLKFADAAVSDRFASLMNARVALRFGHHLASVEATDRGLEVGTVDDDGIEYFFGAEQLLLATGRTPNSDTLDLHHTGVDVDPLSGRVIVDEFQRTTAEGIYALGDVSSPYQLRHVANHEARVVQHNLLNPTQPIASDHRFVPRAVFSDPQVACVGLTEAECRAEGLDYAVGVRDYGGVAYGWAMEDSDHFAKVIAERGTGRLLGAHIIGPQASVLLQPLIQAMSTGLDARTMARGQYWIHPSLPEVVENALLDLDLG